MLSAGACHSNFLQRPYTACFLQSVPLDCLRVFSLISTSTNSSSSVGLTHFCFRFSPLSDYAHSSCLQRHLTSFKHSSVRPCPSNAFSRLCLLWRSLSVLAAQQVSHTFSLAALTISSFTWFLSIWLASISSAAFSVFAAWSQEKGVTKLLVG